MFIHSFIFISSKNEKYKFILFLSTSASVSLLSKNISFPIFSNKSKNKENRILLMTFIFFSLKLNLIKYSTQKRYMYKNTNKSEIEIVFDLYKLIIL